MERRNISYNEFLKLSFEEFKELKENILSWPLVLLDGTIIEKNGNTTYDNDFDQTLPCLLQGVKNPNEETRKNQRRRKFKMPRALYPLRQKPIKFWIERQTNLSEILSAYPHISVGYKLGNRSANDLLSFLLYTNLVIRKPIQSLPCGEDLFETFEKRCKANGYQGKWRILSKLLQAQRSYIATQGFIKETFSQRSLKGNLVPNGERIFNSLNIYISVFPVNSTQRKRGYSDKGSKKFAHEIHDLTESVATTKVTRDTLDLTPKQALVHFLYGFSNPAKEVQMSKSEIEYKKRINQQLNRKKREEARRIRNLTGPVKVIK